MRIVIDLQGAQNNSRLRGIGRYSLEYAKAIAGNSSCHEVIIMLSSLFPDSIEPIKNALQGIVPDKNFVIFHAPSPVDELRIENAWRVHAAELVREQYIADLDPDVLILCSLFEGSCDNTVSSIGMLPRKYITAVICYDLIPLHEPDKYLTCERTSKWYYRKIESLKRADVFLAISESTKTALVESLRIDASRIIVIYGGVDKLFAQAGDCGKTFSGIARQNGISRRYLMHCGAYEGRKNFDGLIKAFGLIPRSIRDRYQLVLVCKLNDYERNHLKKAAIAAGLAENELVLTGFVSDADLAVLMSRCHIFVFPSFREGLGLPVLEAMSCGAATIASNTTSMPELIEREDALFDPTSPQDIADRIIEVVVNAKLWKELKEHALTQAKKFSWQASAQITLRELLRFYGLKTKLPYVPINKIAPKLLIYFLRGRVGEVGVVDGDLVDVAEAIVANDREIICRSARSGVAGQIRWRVEGPFDSTYSLALINREFARALHELGHFVVLHSTDGPGDMPANQGFLAGNKDIALMYGRAGDYPHRAADVVSRNLYPPRVSDMQSRLNILHHYAWEESGFPLEWAKKFNENLNGITCNSAHVEKILVDSGVTVPVVTTGCGVDHWERITPDLDYVVDGKEFRFLHVSSCFPRKGVDLLLEAFGMAFTSDDDVTLIIKTFTNPHNNIDEQLAQARAANIRYPDVQVIFGDLNDSQLKSLYEKCSVLVAPSKAEGFGLPLAEAMLCGLPVITTNWGGQLDFCTHTNSWLVDYEFERAQTHFGLFASVWAKANVRSLSEAMRSAYGATLSERSAMAQEGRKRLLEQFRWSDATSRTVSAVRIWSGAADEGQTPRVGWVTPWNTRCGIATYSEHMISNMPDGAITVFAPYADKYDLTHEDDSRCVRCWVDGKEENRLDSLERHMGERCINTLVIQFNYGLFNFMELGRFIDRQLKRNLVVMVVLHASRDPYGARDNWMLSELRGILVRCHRVLVHSVTDMNRLKAIGIIDNVTLFPHGIIRRDARYSTENESAVPLIATYGFCLENKGLSEVIRAVSILKDKGHVVRLRMVNAEYPVAESAKLVTDLKGLICELGVAHLVEFYSDFRTDEKSLSLLECANLVVFAYQESGESASGAARYGLAARRPVAVTPLSIFDDLGEAVFRFKGVGAEDIATGITTFLHEIANRSDLAIGIRDSAEKWREQHDYALLGRRFFNVCTALLRKTHKYVYLYDGSSQSLRSEIGMIDGGAIITSGKAGMLVYGPYAAANPGRYRLKIYGDSQCWAGSEWLDIACDHGRTTLAKVDLDSFEAGSWCQEIEFEVKAGCSSLEYRLWVGEESILRVERIEVSAT